MKLLEDTIGEYVNDFGVDKGLLNIRGSSIRQKGKY